MNIYLHELKIYWKSSITWIYSILGILVFFMSIFPVIYEDIDFMQQMLANFPEEFLRAFGMATVDLSSELGFYSFVFSYVLIAGSIQAMNLGVSVLSSELREKTADFLLAKPVTRNKIITSKILAVFTHIFITNVIFVIATRITVDLFKKNTYDVRILLLISITLFFVQLFFVSFGLFSSVLIGKIRTVVPLSLGVVFGFYIINLLNDTLGDEKLTYLTPFAYFNSENIIKTGSYDPKYLILCGILIITFTVATYVIYSKKDIPSV